jgi:hypothetical protein
VCEQIGHDLRDVLRCKLPLVVAERPAAEFSANGAGQDVRHSNAVLPDLLHQRLAERIETRFRGAIRAGLRNAIFAARLLIVDDPARAARAKMRKRGPEQ